MESMVEYLIPYKGLSIGKHDYQFHAQDSFFAALESESIAGGDLKVSLVLDKQSRLMIATLHLEGTIKLACDRCLELFDFPVFVDYEQIYKYGNSPEINEDDIHFLDQNEYQLDVSQLILENILLEIPIKRVHKEDNDGNPTCNPKQIKLIQSYGKKKQIDPRWDALKNLKFED